MTKFNPNPGRDLPPKHPRIPASLSTIRCDRLGVMFAAEATEVPEELTRTVVHLASAWLRSSTLQARKN